MNNDLLSHIPVEVAPCRVCRTLCKNMAAAAAAALLDELMGRNRNVLPNEKPKELNWEDPEVNCLQKVDFLYDEKKKKNVSKLLILVNKL